jgi:hypothetical protein
MAMGIPLIRFKYNSEMNPNLIPDYHYISVDRPDEIILDNQLNSSHAYLIEDKFIQIKNDVNFLNFISDNAKNYYDNYIKGINGVNHTIKLLELDKWIQKCN